MQGAAIQLFIDLRHLNAAEGASSFLCIPALAPAVAAAGYQPAPTVLLVSYVSTAEAHQEQLRLALLLAGQLSWRHDTEFQEHGAHLHRTLHPKEDRSWGSGYDAEYPELSSSADGSENEDGIITGGGEQTSSSSTGIRLDLPN